MNLPFGWFFRARGEARSHDAEIAALSSGLARWGENRLETLAQELDDAEEHARQRGLPGPGLGKQPEMRCRRAAKKEARHQVEQANTERNRILAAEDFRHRLWRRLRPAPEVEASAHVSGLLRAAGD